MNDKTLVLIIGLVAGLLVACIGGMLLLAAGGARPAAVTPGPPAGALIEAAVSEDYLSRTFPELAAGGTDQSPVLDGRVDIQPGNRMRFVAQLDTPLGLFTVAGVISLAVQNDQIKVHLLDVRAGQVPITLLLMPFVPSIEARINEAANQEIARRTGPAKVRLLGMTSDDTQLTVYLAGK